MTGTDYSFIVDEMQWSYSRASSFKNCAYGWCLNYIQCVDKVDNFFSDYGLLIHGILEMFFKNELEIYELADYYQDHYQEFVKCSPPAFPQGMGERYYTAGLNFFMNFDFDKDAYDVIGVEDSIEMPVAGHNMILKPDLILRHKVTGKCILVDYKTADVYRKSNTPDKNKIEDYKKQMYLYCLGIREKHNIDIAEIHLWFVRVGKVHKIIFNQAEQDMAVQWFSNMVDTIKKEREWSPNATKENEYYCKNLCGERNICKYIQQFEN